MAMRNKHADSVRSGSIWKTRYRAPLDAQQQGRGRHRLLRLQSYLAHHLGWHRNGGLPPHGDTGILQHAIFSLPNNQEGYTTDDNARALIVTTIFNGSGQLWTPEHSLLSRRYLAFLWLAFDQEKGRFRNFLSYGREWQEEIGSEDSHGRALWSLGKVFCYPGGQN